MRTSFFEKAGIFLVFIVISILLQKTALSNMSENVSFAPVNPDFTAYQAAKFVGKIQAFPSISTNGHTLGYIPPPVALPPQKATTSQSILKVPSFPSSYDLRLFQKLPPVRNQDQCGDCWAHAAYASLEGGLAVAESRNFSEAHLNDSHGFSHAWCNGGNDNMAVAYLARWSGPGQDAAYPHPISGAKIIIPEEKHVQNVDFLPDRSGYLDNDAIKDALMNTGPVTMSYYVGEEETYYNATAHTWYNPTSSHAPNHAVAIVGWNDTISRNTFPITPPGDGAFIVRNSWGIDWGENGYFYLSYYDATMHPGAAFNNAEPTGNFSHVYEYDPLGWTNSSGFNSDTAWFSNIFSAESYNGADTAIEGVSFYTQVPNSTYNLMIYNNVSSGNPRSGTMMVNLTGTIVKPGYHTVHITSTPLITPGRLFSIVVKLKTPDYLYPIPIESSISSYSEKATASTGQSFVSKDGKVWTDFGKTKSANVCLKALARNGLTPDIFSFRDQTSVDLSTYIYSDQIVIEGVIYPAEISITGGEYKIDAGSYTAAPGVINNGQKLILRHLSANTPNTAKHTVVTIWGVHDTFSSLTGSFFPFLKVSKLGMGSGTVTSSPTGIDCGSTCSSYYHIGQTVTLTASPSPGFLFAGWGGACSGSALTCTLSGIRVFGETSVSATFVPICPVSNISLWQTVNNSWDSGCTSAHRGSAYYARYYSFTVPSSQTVTIDLMSSTQDAYLYLLVGDNRNGSIVASNDDHSAIGSWNSRINMTLPAGTYTAEATTHQGGQTGEFLLMVTGGGDHTLTVSRTGAGNGIVRSSPSGIICYQICSASYVSGANVTLTATADSDSAFGGWGGACSGTAPTCTVSMTEAKAVTATFYRSVTCTESDMSIGETVSGLWDWDCKSVHYWREGGLAQYYKFTVPSRQLVTIDLVSPKQLGQTRSPYPYIYLLSGDSRYGQVIATNDDYYYGIDHSHIEMVLDAGTYTVEAATQSGVEADFSLTVARGDTLAVTKLGTGNGNVTSLPMGLYCGLRCSASYISGTSVVLTANASSGSTFAGWSGACSGTASTCTVSVTTAKSVTATFNLQTYALSVSKSGKGGGTVTSTPIGINCGTDCTEPYTIGTNVTLTAIPNVGTRFTGWAGACSGTASTCTVSMKASKSVTSTFDKVYTLTVASNGTVTSTPTGINCGTDCTEPYTIGTNVTLTAISNAGTRFTGWSGACSGTKPTCTVSMTASKSVTATFKPVYTLTVSKTGAGSGTVGSSPAGISCGEDCMEDYIGGTRVKLTATVKTGSKFIGWSGACAGITTMSCTVAMSEAKTVGANFNIITFPLIMVNSGNGTVISTPTGINCGTDCTEPYATGTKVTLTATPNVGTRFTGWSGACSGTKPTCTVSMTASKSVTAAFKPVYTLTVSKTDTGSGTVGSSPAGISCGEDCMEDYIGETRVKLTATVKTGSKFIGWSGACAGITTMSCTVAMSEAKTVGANFVTH